MTSFRRGSSTRGSQIDEDRRGALEIEGRERKRPEDPKVDGVDPGRLERREKRLGLRPPEAIPVPPGSLLVSTSFHV